MKHRSTMMPWLELSESSPMIPWLGFTHEGYEGHTLSTSFLNNKSYSLKNIPALRGIRDMCGSQFGLLILIRYLHQHDNGVSITLWNPVTLKSIRLPPLYHDINNIQGSHSCCLTSPPPNADDDTSHCFVLFFFRGLAFARRCPPPTDDTNDPATTSDDETDSDSDSNDNVEGCHWFSERIEIDGEPASVSKAVALNGNICAWASRIDAADGLVTTRLMVSIHVVGSSSNSNSLAVSYLSIKMPNVTFPCSWKIYMVESCGTIYMAQAGGRSYKCGVHVKVWELDLHNQTTIEVNSLGGRALFLSQDASTWAWPAANTTVVHGDCLYIFDSHLSSDAVLLYDLKSSASRILPCPEFQNRPRVRPLWVMPHHPCRSVAGLDQYRPSTSINADTGALKKSSCLVANTSKCEKVMQQNNETGQGAEDYLSELPQHLIGLVSKYMHLFDCWSFRCTSKIIQSAAPVPGWRTHNLFPLLLVFENNHDGSCRLIDPSRDDFRSCVLQLPEKYSTIESSMNGWLIVSSGYDLQFYNPLTKERGDFPQTECEIIGFSTYPTCSKCLTIAIDQGLDQITISYHQSGEQKWNSHHFDISPNVEFSSGTPIYDAGAFYFLDKVGYLGVVKFVDGDITWEIYGQPVPVIDQELHYSSYLVKCGGEFLSVFIGPMGNGVWVFRFDHSQKIWVPIETLENHTLFIGPYSNFSVDTKGAKMMNDRIYLPWMKEGRIVYYSLKTHKYRINDDEDYFIEDLSTIEHPSRCCWF